MMHPKWIVRKWRKKLRRQILYVRDGKHCFYCECNFENHPHNGPYSGRIATIDHVVPKSKGGKDKLSNMVLSCAVCNSAHRSSLERYRLHGDAPSTLVAPSDHPRGAEA